MAAFGEDEAQGEFLRFVPNLNLPPLFGLQKTVLHGALDKEISNIAFALGFAQGDEDVPAVTFLIAIHDHPR